MNTEYMIKMSETRDHVAVRIDNILLDLPSTPSKPSIFRVNDDLRRTNENLYDPKVLAIGPLHHGKDQVCKMEQQKFRYLKLLLQRKNEFSVDKYVMAIRSFEEKARKCYAEHINFDQDEFVEMLILDGFFIIELLRKHGIEEFRDKDDTIFQYEQILSRLRHDLFLVENQIPLFILDQLFSMTKTGNPDDNIDYLIHLFIDDISPWPDISEATLKLPIKNIDHLLGLVHKIWCSSFAKMVSFGPDKTEEHKVLAVNSTNELEEAGIKFEKDTKSNGLDIKFINGVMKIPGLHISDESETLFRNMIAYEHCFPDDHAKCITDYAFFMHCLINSSKDVEALRRVGIITNFLGDDGMVYHMFNRIGRYIPTSSDFCYQQVFEKVNRHCGQRRNRWMANLRRNYFNTPWAFVSFFAAVMLLIFTLTQTVFSVLSYKK
ncbi:UPF0481 protein At3g47200-like [Olea europaea var. sylvestris]|uniref:UPF0481 protein At3g47200-like n=1 Tax=Olea europaea var. sylvestris TaxID=158386 RepID=UPI000C1CFB75|nr:UPF0481 protein At3g47200-like [Olea europaea var. sylvestris]XP_022875995.1 UPF0481 protein At3g47200-like [Olea europaea var. sylvestris]XP_022875996.1 UPF0481 protein At3g47200-like [Olea europaea var. sylvestris]XP_022875998.1 UPF0481 protein At3g47200-like [Olea europaea var. sylvestris]XP_022875999.1 UPF0481 protein At3g47200-like [Olea europaea var. sylvestris]